jgi:hypothetical protein
MSDYFLQPENILRNLRISQLHSVATQLLEMFDDSHVVLFKNRNGNLAIMRVDNQEYVGYVDLLTGEIVRA